MTFYEEERMAVQPESYIVSVSMLAGDLHAIEKAAADLGRSKADTLIYLLHLGLKVYESKAERIAQAPPREPLDTEAPGV